MPKYRVEFLDDTHEDIVGDRLWDTVGSVSVLRDNGQISAANKPVYDTVALYPLVNILSIKEI